MLRQYFRMVDTLLTPIEVCCSPETYGLVLYFVGAVPPLMLTGMVLGQVCALIRPRIK